ncbi:ubiquitin-associated domain-containing protein 1-like [Sycon ciliatum]|uniref:ubiquitin-associated domain-containing protein 1-like n=1 Tax=Sycon ciliatum TaxID=27933 RepID=UPI0020AC46F7|eukprot:scpid70892/ scgid14324/ Ubiquitin-associated domain-containing protein 1; E3 ubiquitin-protein ligase subunit KPC2; Kip1 ubiquitination-promoting complex protein 2
MRLLLRNDCDSSVWVDVSPNDTLADLRSSLPSDAQDAARLPCTTGSRAAFVMRTGRRVPLYEFPELSSEIQDGDEILLLSSSFAIDTSSMTPRSKDSHAAQSEVDEVTAGIPAVLFRPRISESESPMDSLHQRTHLALLEFAGRLQSLTEQNNAADEEEDEDAEEESEDAQQSTSQVDEMCVTHLVEMGFPRERAIKALRLTGEDEIAAAEWLLLNSCDPSVDDPLPATPPKPKARSRRGRWRQQEFVPSQSALHNLKEIGFDEAAIITALKATNNNQEQACEFLLSGQTFTEPTPLDKSSPLYKDLFSNSMVLNSLTKPSVLEALIRLQDSPDGGLAAFMHDKDCGLFLHVVTRIVQKHVPEMY